MFSREKKQATPSSTGKEREKSGFIQPKLKVGKAGDAYEVEADRMADKVVNKTTSDKSVQKKNTEEEVQQKPIASEITPFVQKMETEKEEPVQKMEEEEAVQKQEEEETVQSKEEEEAVQSKCENCEKEEAIQKQEEEEAVQSKEEEEVQTKKANTNTGNKGVNAIEGKLRRGSGGSKMDVHTQNEMEAGFGADFSQVTIHTDSQAQQMSADIGAQAFTHGNDIYFNKGKYNPSTKEGKHLLAHELTHTIQQKGMVQKKLQRKPAYKGAVIQQNINLFDASTAPAGNPLALGHTAFIIDGNDFKTFYNSKGKVAAMNLLFPLPKVAKIGGTCFVTDKDINLQAYSAVRIITPNPWGKRMKKSEAEMLLGGALKAHLTDMPAEFKVVFRGKISDKKLRADDLKAEMQHANDNKCLFKKYIGKYQDDVNASFPSGYFGLGSCDARLEEQLGREARITNFVKDYMAFGDFYDQSGGSHFATVSVSKSTDKTTLFIDMGFGALPTAGRTCN